MAAISGYLGLLKWATSYYIVPVSKFTFVCSYAAQGGHLEVLKWARETGCEWNSPTCSSAAKGGHFEVKVGLGKWLCMGSKYAVQGGHFDI